MNTQRYSKFLVGFFASLIIFSMLFNPAQAAAGNNTQGNFISGTLSTWKDGSGRWWVENDYYRIELSEASSFVIKTGTGEREWRIFPTGTVGQWIGAGANNANQEITAFWYWSVASNIESINVTQPTADKAIATIIGYGNKTGKEVRVEVVMTFLAGSPEIKIDSQLLWSGDTFSISTFIYNFFLGAGGDKLNDKYTYSGGVPANFPYSSWDAIYASELIPVTNDYIHVSIYDTAVKQGLAFVTKKNDTSDMYTDTSYGRAIVEGAIYGWQPRVGIHMNASRPTTFYIYPFTIGDSNPVAPVEAFISMIIAPISINISGNVGISGATLSFIDGASKSVVSYVNGDYSLSVSSGWSGIVTPTKPGYVFSPDQKTYTNVATNLISQNYSATMMMGSSFYGSGQVTSDRL